jgi:hypothetical protein
MRSKPFGVRGDSQVTGWRKTVMLPVCTWLCGILMTRLDARRDRWPPPHRREVSLQASGARRRALWFAALISPQHCSRWCGLERSPCRCAPRGEVVAWQGGLLRPPHRAVGWACPGMKHTPPPTACAGTPYVQKPYQWRPLQPTCQDCYEVQWPPHRHPGAKSLGQRARAADGPPRLTRGVVRVGARAMSHAACMYFVGVWLMTRLGARWRH